MLSVVLVVAQANTPAHDLRMAKKTLAHASNVSMFLVGILLKKLYKNPYAYASLLACMKNPKSNSGAKIC